MKIPEYSRAAVLRRYSAPLKIENVPIPQVIEPGAILVKTDCCTICGTDVHLSNGGLARPVELPVIVGHEMTGSIVAFGSGAERDSVGQDLRIGDRIVWTRTNCGHCYMCTVAAKPTLCQNARAYMYETMERAPYLLGGFSDYVYVLPESGRVKVPESVASPLASMASCAFRSVIHAVEELGEVRHTDTVVVQGTGPLGLLATGVARMSGARRVIAIGAPDGRLDLARDFGADDVLSVERTSAEERRAFVLDATGGRGADVVMEFAGNPHAFTEGLHLARRGGSYLLVGQLGQGEVTIKPSTFVNRNLRVLGSLAGGAKDYWAAMEFIRRHGTDLPFGRLISNSYGLDQVNDALTAMRNQTEVKPVITFGNMA
ncbi:zinc-binding dehydrogenase [Falsirhodobacter halotolerans]|uniref:zinc-binding dehydrogenase n=1 Tax=Falsirhodobacter halotolerans TaxID=1146892 RepID=UPI001FD5B762|nr:zinc-binding dehydrogenase [Falsirhodobacter halotolerans]MCJ8139116.1 zinc-binding dehydrogenase [Falsirhodobacter halotolerans]